MVDAKETPKKSKKKLVILAIIILGSISAVAGYFLFKGDAPASDQDMVEGEAEVLEIAPPPIFVKVGPITVNLNDELGQHLLYTGLMLKVDNTETENIINTHMPEINSRLLLLLSSKSSKELSSIDGKKKLAEQILTLFDEPLTKPQPTLAISAVLFSDFILQ